MTNPYPQQIVDLVQALDETGCALEVGSGARSIDPRVIGLEIVETRGVDVVGNAMSLPFADESFDLVFSQAVMEHVSDPQLAIDEMTRVMRPGAVLYIEVAFMQPVHQEPLHFFNHTPYGIQHLCRELETLEIRALGTIAETVRWIGEEAEAPAVLGRERWEDIIADLETVHSTINPDRNLRIASGVAFAGRKCPLSV